MARLSRIFIFLLLPLTVLGQQFGGTPPSQHWKQLNTDTARIIFPAGLDSAANRIGSIVHYLAANSRVGNGAVISPLSLGNQQRKINIVLQNHTTIGNGYVSLGPFRSEFYLTPILNNFEEGSVPWADQLAVHEYRHVMQYNNFRNGISKLMFFLFGEEGYDLSINAAIPDWFYEGDAVYNETILTQQGRGRLPLFLNAYPSLWMAGKKYSWMKLRNGSFKDYVPNHYYLGYLLVNYGREKYGMDFWRKVTTDASSFKGLLYPFQHAIKKHAGVDYKTFRQQAFDFYKQPFQQKIDSLPRLSTALRQVSIPKNYVTDYLFPYSISADSLLVLKKSYRHRTAFYLLDGKEEHKLRTRDISIDDQYSYRNGKIVYAAYKPDLRWGWRDYSDIRLLDIKSGRQRSLTHKAKYFTPDISPSGKNIAAIHINEKGISELHILDAENGKLVTSIHSSEINLFTDPKFIDENQLVTAVRLRDGKMALALAEISTGNTTRLTPPSFNVIGNPSVNGDRIYFTASYQGNDDVFVLQTTDKKILQVTTGPLGNYFVNAANDMISWSAFTADGYQLRQIQEKDIVYKEVTLNAIEQSPDNFTVSNAAAMSGVLLDSVKDRSFPISDYKKSTRLINIHSWRPYYEDPIFTYSLYGENVLNTLQTELYYLYNQDEKTSSTGFNTSFAQWFPVLSAGVEYTFARERRFGNRIWQWDQLDARVGFNIPLNFSEGRSYRFINAGSNYFHRNQFNKGFFKDSLGNTSFSYLHHFLSVSQQVQRAVQHIYPKWGYGANLNHRHAISDVKSWQFIGTANIYLPGIASNHSIVLTGAFQETDTVYTAFANRFPYSRGFNEAYFARMWRLSANYHFPLWHTDFGLANILYLQRIRTNAFYDYTRCYSRNKTTWLNQQSTGGEMYFDTKWWNQYELTFGFRVSYLLDRDLFTPARRTVWEFILPVSIFPR